MDRNRGWTLNINGPMVALRKESVDRNYIIKITGFRPAVALRKESVDRNVSLRLLAIFALVSLSARRAWIEMPDSTHRQEPFPRRSPQGERG